MGAVDAHAIGPFEDQPADQGGIGGGFGGKGYHDAAAGAARIEAENANLPFRKQAVALLKCGGAG